MAQREFGEETGHVVGSSARVIALGSITQRGGKVVHAWAVEGDLDPADCWSNTFAMEWPPHSGIFIDVPELDRVAWFSPEAARSRDEPRPGGTHRPAPRGIAGLTPRSAHHGASVCSTARIWSNLAPGRI